jgi:adenylate cyclase
MTEEDLRLQFFSDPETGKPKRVIVLIGATGTAMQETKVTPIGAMQGIEVHANILMSMLDNSFLHPSPPWLWVALILGGGLLLGVVLPWLNPRLGTLLLIALFTGTLYGAYNMLARHNIIVDNLSPVLLNLVAVTAGVHLFHYLSVRKAQSRLSSLLKELAPLPSPLIEEYMRRSEGALDLGGKKQTLTILFCDIRGYTDMSERMDPVSVMDTLNEYYSAMGAIFQKHGGMIFDYIGDAQMVVFGIADGSEDNHAVAACLTGLDMGEKIEEMRRQWHLQGKNTFEVGVGISTGPVSLGLIGSSQRKQFTAIGDTTNVAARIQGLSAQLNSKVTITQATYEMAKDSIAVEELKPVKVKGKAEPINVYKVIGVKERDLSRN